MSDREIYEDIYDSNRKKDPPTPVMLKNIGLYEIAMANLPKNGETIRIDADDLTK